MPDKVSGVNWKRCPNCGGPGIKNRGCKDKFTCLYCGKTFRKREKEA